MKKSVWLLRYGRLYVWHKYDSHGDRLGLNTDDFVVVEEKSSGLVTHPKPFGGVFLDESPESQDAVRRVLLLHFDPKSSYLVFVARPDTYSAFHHVRDRAIELGFWNIDSRLLPRELAMILFLIEVEQGEKSSNHTS